MNREQIIAMAREADPGFDDKTLSESLVGYAAIATFAALVAAAEREEILAIKPQDLPGGINATAGPAEVWTKLMDAIRARGTK